MRCVFTQRFLYSDLYSGSAVTGANCWFSETSSQRAKKAPEDSHYDAPIKVQRCTWVELNLIANLIYSKNIHGHRVEARCK